jgi:hypothetical protein
MDGENNRKPGTLNTPDLPLDRVKTSKQMLACCSKDVVALFTWLITPSQQYFFFHNKSTTTTG